MAAAVQPKPVPPPVPILSPNDGCALKLCLACSRLRSLVPGFTVADLVHLERGRIIATRWTVGQDVPLRVNDELIAWSEFEIVQNRLAVRLTELA